MNERIRPGDMFWDPDCKNAFDTVIILKVEDGKHVFYMRTDGRAKIGVSTTKDCAMLSYWHDLGWTKFE